jgi:hypothetical protein
VGQVKETIEKVVCYAPIPDEPSSASNQLTTRIREDLTKHLTLCLEMAQQLDPDFSATGLDTEDPLEDKKLFRDANLLRHHMVALPLLNYTDFQGSLTADYPQPSAHFQQKKLQFSPRHVPFEQCMLFHLASGGVSDPLKAFAEAKSTFQQINSYEPKEIEVKEVEVEK